MKGEHYATGAFILVLLGALYLIIREGRRLLDIGIGDDPLGIVGGDNLEDEDESNDPGILTRFFMAQSGSPKVGTYGTERGSMWDWDPFNWSGHGSSWGIFGRPS